MIGLTALVVWQFAGPSPAPAPVPPLAAESPLTGLAGEREWEGLAEAQAVMAAARAAVKAWGAFATSGDLEALDAHFDPAGPQYEQLAAETDERASDPARYELRMAVVNSYEHGAGWLVDGDVRMRRDGQPAGAWSWQLELRHHPEHGWRIWTVVER